MLNFIVILFRVKSGFDRENLMWLEQLFRQTVGNEMEIKRDDFNKILITKNVSFIDYFTILRIYQNCIAILFLKVIGNIRFFYVYYSEDTFKRD